MDMQTIDAVRPEQAAPDAPSRQPFPLPGGAIAAAGLLVVLGGLGWLVLSLHQADRQALRIESAQAVGRVLAYGCEPLLSAGRLDEVRLIVSDTAREHSFHRLRILLPSGEVLAAGDPESITLAALPDSWSGAVPVRPEGREPSGIFVERFPMQVAGRGQAAVEIATVVREPVWRNWPAQAGLAGMLAFSLATLVGLHLLTRRSTRSVRHIREALLAIAAGEPATAAMTIRVDGAPEATAWNKLLEDTDELRKAVVIDHARQTLGARSGGVSDLNGACDAISQGLVLLDARMCVKYANGAAGVLLKTRREEIIGAEFNRLLPDAAICKAVEGAVKGNGPRRVSLVTEVPGEGGVTTLRVSIRPMRKEDNAAAVVSIEDITQQKAADAARNSFVAHATHELRTPLTNIRLYVETAIEEGEHDVALRAKCLNVVNSETRRLERMVGEILSVSEIEAGSFHIERDDVRLSELFVSLQQDFQAQADDKGLEFEFDLPPKLPVIQADRDRLTMALHNLVGNALKYTLAPGRVTVKVHVEPDKLTVQVRDSGIGIPKDDAERIFERFYRVSDERVRQVGGSGLGLALAREVIRLHGGDITVESVLNEGSTFVVTLPVSVEEAG